MKKEKIKKEKKKWSKKKKVIVTAVGVCLLACACSSNTEDKKEAVETTTDVVVVDEAEPVVDAATIAEATEALKEHVEGRIVGELLDFTYDPSIVVHYKTSDVILDGVNNNIYHILLMIQDKALYNDKVDLKDVDIIVDSDYYKIDQSNDVKTVVKASFKADTIKDMDFTNMAWDEDMSKYASDWWVHPNFK